MATLTARVGGMTCGACVRNVEQALGGVPGARSVRVDLAAREAVVEHDGTATVHAMRAAVEAAGFTLEPARGLPAPIEPLRTLVSRPAVVGPVAALVLLAIYLGLISLAQGWDHALQQFEQDRPFVLLLAAGFGIQASLYTSLRAHHARAAAGGASMAASSGTSTAAMLACCAHHLTEVLPILGVSGLAAFLGTYKTPLLWLGLAMNLAGISYLTWQLRRPRLSSSPSPRLDRQAGPGMSSLRWPRR